MTLATDALCSVEDVKNHLELTTINEHDDLVSDLINIYTQKFESYCGVKSFKTTQYTEYYDGNGDSFLYPKNTPITTISLLADDENYVWGTDSTFSSTEYRIVDEGKGIYLIDDIFGKFINNIKITYTGGYTTIPDDLRHSCIREVGRAFKHRKDWEVISETLAEKQSTYIEPSLGEDTIQVLSYYKNNWV